MPGVDQVEGFALADGCVPAGCSRPFVADSLALAFNEKNLDVVGQTVDERDGPRGVGTR